MRQTDCANGPLARLGPIAVRSSRTAIADGPFQACASAGFSSKPTSLQRGLRVSTANLDGVIRDGRHEMQVRIYFEDTDFGQIVYHANYLRFMERGRTNYLRLLGADHRALFEETAKEAPGFAFVVRSMNIDFLKPARMDDVLEVFTEPQEVRGASVTLQQRCMRGDELLVEASVR